MNFKFLTSFIRIRLFSLYVHVNKSLSALRRVEQEWKIQHYSKFSVFFCIFHHFEEISRIPLKMPTIVHRVSLTLQFSQSMAGELQPGTFFLVWYETLYRWMGRWNLNDQWWESHSKHEKSWNPQQNEKLECERSITKFISVTRPVCPSFFVVNESLNITGDGWKKDEISIRLSSELSKHSLHIHMTVATQYTHLYFVRGKFNIFWAHTSTSGCRESQRCGSKSRE